MRPAWDDVIARVSGLRTHLLTQSAVGDLARQPTLAALGHRLRQTGYLPGSADGSDPIALELAVRRSAAARLRTLARWCRHRPPVLRVVFEDEDRRSLRQLVRGVVEGAPPAQRAAGLLPTPALPERALEELARSDTVASMGALLAAWGHPHAPVLLASGAARRPQLLPLEVALSRRFFERALVAARADAAVRTFIRESIDLENIWTAAILAGAPDLDMTACFIPGGARIGPALAREAAALPDFPSALRALAGALGPTRIARALAEAAGRPADLEPLVLAARRQEQWHRRRLAPLSLAPVLAYVLAVRLEVIAIQRVIWGLTLGAPPAELTGEAAA